MKKFTKHSALKMFFLALIVASNGALAGAAAHWRREALEARQWVAAVEWEATCLVEAATNGK